MAGERDRTVRVIRPGHGGVTSVNWSPDGTRLALGDNERGVSVWTADGRALWRVEHSSHVYHTVWSPDGRRMASQGARRLCVWDAAGQVVWQQDNAADYSCPGWSPDGRQLAYGDSGSAIRVVDAATGATARELAGHTSSVVGAAWSPDGRTLVSGSVDNTVRVWDATTGACAHVFAGHTGGVYAVAVSPDGEQAASGSSDGTVRVWDRRTETGLAQCNGRGGGAWRVSWSPDGRLVASGGTDNTVLIWEAATGREAARLTGHTALVQSVGFAPGGGLLASASPDGTVRVWDVSDLVPPTAPAARATPLAGYAARQLATVGRRPRAAAAGPPWVPRLPGADGGRLLGVLDRAGQVVSLLSGDRLLAVGDRNGRIRLLDLDVGTARWEATAADRRTSQIQAVRASPDGRRLASCSIDQTVRVWDAVTGTCLAVCTGVRGAVQNVTWSPDGGRIAAGVNSGGGVRVWDALTGQLMTTLTGHEQAIDKVDWSPDGRALAAGDAANRVLLWDPNTNKLVRRWDPHPYTIWSLRWSPDGMRLAVGDSRGGVLVCDEHGTTLARCVGHTRGVVGLAWSPSGTLLGSAGQDDTVRVWDPQTGREVACFRGEDTEFSHLGLSWSPGGGFLAAAAFLTSDGSREQVRLWDVRDLLPSAPPTAPATAAAAPVPPPLRPLPSALGQAHRAGLHPPLSLVADLLALLAGRVPPELAPLAARPGAAALAALRWPAAARTGLALLLLRDAPPPPGCDPPPGAGPAAVRDALAAALAASDPCDPEPPAAPLAALERAADRVTPAVLDLLRLAGPRAVAADPALPLRLAAAAAAPPATRAAPRRAIVPARTGGGTRAPAPGPGPRAGFDRVGDLRALVPSQLALPPDLLAYRHRAGGLLYRSRPAGAEPRVRPLVLVLDVSPASYGPVEALTRPAAARAARAAIRAGMPVAAVLAGGRPVVCELRREADLADLLSARSAGPGDAAGSLRLARGLCRALAGGPDEPAVLVLAPTSFGWDAPPPGRGPGPLRGLFVRPPGSGVAAAPPWASAFDRWVCLAGGAAGGDLDRALDHLLG